MRSDMFMAPLRASRAALNPYLDSVQHGYAGAEKYARAKAQDLVQHPPQAARILTHRYFLMSLAVGACFFAVRRWQRWRRLHAHGGIKPRARQTARKTSPPRKPNRGPAPRSARLH